MKGKSVTIKAAWIGFSAIIIAAIIYGLFIIYSSNAGKDTKINTIDTKTNKGVVSGNVENQTNNFYQSDSNFVNENQELKNENKNLKNKESVEPSLKNDNRQIKTNLYVENMSGGVAVGNIENLNINTDDIEDLLPFQKCAELEIQQKTNSFIIELKVKQGEWSPVMVGIPLDEKEKVNPSIFDTKSSIIPGIINFQSSGIMVWEEIIEINNKRINYWFKLFQSPELSQKNSIFVECEELPSSIIWGIYPDKTLVYKLAK